LKHKNWANCDVAAIINKLEIPGVSECQEADQLLANVRKSKRANRSSGTRTSAKLNGRKKNRKAA
jgi:hypothetical protein